jgi:PBSX family phage terminase large subunit
MKTVKLLKHQWKFMTSDKKYAVLYGGLGSGKTFVGAHWAIAQCAQYPETVGFIGANTQRQLREVALATLFEQLEAIEAPYTYNQNRGIVRIGDTRIIVRTLKNYNVLRGLEFGWAWIDEARDCEEEAWLVCQGRLREKRGPLTARLTTTPRGFDWVYQRFVEANHEDYDYITAKTGDNKFLPENYELDLKSAYDDRMYRQEVLGEIVNLNQGAVYYSFDRDKHITDTAIQNHPIMVGMDFNISPFTAVFGHYINGKLYIFDEMYLKDSNTYEVADWITQKYGRNLMIIPDSTGRALKTASAGESDHSILKQAGFRIPPVKNPFRADRYNCVNSMLEKGEIVIDPKCKQLIRDLEQVTFKEGTNVPDTKNKDLTHISDALGYLCWHVKPLIKRKVTVSKYA